MLSKCCYKFDEWSGMNCVSLFTILFCTVTVQNGVVPVSNTGISNAPNYISAWRKKERLDKGLALLLDAKQRT